jgi:hypothetical protein
LREALFIEIPMKINQVYELFVQDLVMRIMSNPGFELNNANLEKVFQTAFGVAEKYFPRWEVERERLTETLAKLPEAWGGVAGEPQDEPEAPVRGNARPRRQKRQKRLLFLGKIESGHISLPTFIIKIFGKGTDIVLAVIAVPSACR